MNPHLDSGITFCAALLAAMTGYAGTQVAQVAQGGGTPDWVSLIIGPFGGLIIGALFLRHSISQNKKDNTRNAALETKLIEVLERTASLAGRSDERASSSTAVIARNTEILEKVHHALAETNRLLERADGKYS